MNKFLTLLIALTAVCAANAQSVFYEDFENGLNAQFTQEYIFGTLDWQNDPTGMALGASPALFEGDSTAHFYASGNTEDRTSLVSPSMDLSAGGYRLSFAHSQGNWAGDQNTLAIHYSGDDGATWTLIDSITDNLPQYVEVEYVLNDYVTTTATSKIRFDGYATWGYAIGLDVVNVFLPPASDAEVTAATSPVDGCGLGLETVSIEVYNNGLDTIFSIQGGYQVGAQTETETFTDTIPSGATVTLTFTVPADLSAPGTYDITAWVDLNEDIDATNDSVFYSVESIPVIASLPYMEDFENGAGGWVSGGTLDPWELGDPETAFIDTAHSGVNAWVTNLTGTYPNNTAAYVESPCMDFSSLQVDPVFRFAFITNAEVGWDGTWVEVSTDAGATWATVGSVGEGTNWYNNADEHGSTGADDWWDAPFGGAGEWSIATHLLDGAAGSSSVKVRVFFDSDGSVNAGYEGFAFDDVEIFEQPSINAGVTEIITPITGCGLGMETVTVVIENFGDADLVNFAVEYDAGSGVVSEIVTDTLFAASVDTFTFATALDLSVTGDYDFGVWTAVVGDGDLLNDSIFSLITSAPVVTSLPYTEDFENGTGGWYSTGEEGIWELGDPEGVQIDTANSGVNAWATNLNTLNYVDNQISYLISPCFDFSSLLIDPILEFAFNGDSEAGWDGMWLEVSTDAGQTWSTVGNTGEGTNWYNNEDEHGANFDEDWWDGNSGGWINAEHLLDGVAGYSDVIVRFAFTSDGIISTYEGFAVDDINLTEQPPINSEVVSINSPSSDCGLTDTEYIEVTVANLGSLAMDSLIVSYSVNNGTPVTEVFEQVIAVSDSATVTFNAGVDMNTPGDYEIVVWTSTVNDGDTSNDTISTLVVSVPFITTFPYYEDFENGSGGWRSEGTFMDWELGDPEGNTIDTAYSGVNAWATNLNTLNYMNSEYTVLQSPCLDLSNMSDDPFISFAIIHSSENNWDGSWVELSTDGGTTWNLVGSVGEGVNWYNSNNFFNGNIEQGFTGLSAGGPSWMIAEHLLDGAAGSSDVRVRIVFSSDASVNGYEGVAVDDVRIYAQPELDLSVISFDGPEDGCNLDQESVTFTFWNRGLQTVSNFPVGFSVNSGAAQYETYTGSVAHNDTVSFTFYTELADLSAAMVHSIDVFTALAGDEFTDSDSLFNNEVENFGTGTPLEQTVTPGLPLSSTIAEGTTSELFFCGLPTSLDGCLEIESVTIDTITHTWMGDLVIYLISPAGDTVELCTNNGGSGDNMFNAVFTDTSVNDITAQGAGILPGYYHPEDPEGFAGLYNGQDPNGAWSLWIDDQVGGDDGILVRWSMTFADHAPTPEIAYSDTTICLTQVLDVTTDEYDSYLWSTGHNSQTAQLFGNVLGLGEYEIYVTVDEGGCTGVSNSFTLTVDACAGVEELGDLSIDIYPNPSNGSITLSIEGQTDVLDLTVQDLNGKIVHAEQLGEVSSRLQKNIDLTGVANGVYLLRLNNGDDSLIKKLVIQ